MAGINGLGDYYSNYSQQDTTADKLSNKLQGADYTKATDDELMDACKEFEAYFVEQMIKSMEKMSSVTGESKKNDYLEYFGDNLTKDLAEKMVDQQDFGLAQTLYEQMKRNYTIEE